MALDERILNASALPPIYFTVFDQNNAVQKICRTASAHPSIPITDILEDNFSRQLRSRDDLCFLLRAQPEHEFRTISAAYTKTYFAHLLISR